MWVQIFVRLSLSTALLNVAATQTVNRPLRHAPLRSGMLHCTQKPSHSVWRQRVGSGRRAPARRSRRSCRHNTAAGCSSQCPASPRWRRTAPRWTSPGACAAATPRRAAEICMRNRTPPSPFECMLLRRQQAVAGTGASTAVPQMALNTGQEDHLLQLPWCDIYMGQVLCRHPEQLSAGHSSPALISCMKLAQ